MTIAPRVAVAALTSTALAVAVAVVTTTPALAAPPPHPGPPHAPTRTEPHHEPPSPVSGPVVHPARDGGHAGGGQARGSRPQLLPTQPRGVDVSGHQGVVDWAKAVVTGAQFAYIKATEGTSYVSPTFEPQYDGSALVGMLRGAYHFALPDRSPAPVQANWFVDHGGSWTPDGKTLPPMIDIEDNPYGSQCYGLAPAQMSGWLQAFSDTVRQRTGRIPTIYTSTRWWKACTGDSPAFGANPLFLAHYDSDPGPMPASWPKETIWQYDDSGDMPGDQDVVRATRADLDALARPITAGAPPLPVAAGPAPAPPPGRPAGRRTPRR